MEMKIIFFCNFFLSMCKFMEVDGEVAPAFESSNWHNSGYYWTLRTEDHQGNRNEPKIMMIVKECNGEDNFKADISVVSYMLSVLSSTSGIVALTILTGVPELIVSVIDEALGLITLALDTLTTFPEKFENAKRKAQSIFGEDVVNDYLNGYGCGGASSRTLMSVLNSSSR